MSSILVRMASEKDLEDDLDSPRWDQSSFTGRLKHFLAVTDPRKTFYTNKELDDAKSLVDAYRQGKIPDGAITIDELWNAKHLVDSSFHPDTGERMNVFGRMSFQLPAGIILGGAMLYWYKTLPQVIFWQWVNQSYNALANYTNRNGKVETSGRQIGVAYVSATTSAVAMSMGFRAVIKKAPPLLGRFAPFVAVAAANCVNIPLMRQRELAEGVEVRDQDGNLMGYSKKAAFKGITQTTLSRISMTVPTLLMLPIFMEKLEKYPFMKRIKPLHGWVQTFFVGVLLVGCVPTGCALFPQRSSLAVDQLEPELQERIANQSVGTTIDTVYFNKGL